MALDKTPKTISLKDLEKIVCLIFKNLESELMNDNVELDHDFYYHIPLDETYKISEGDPEVLVGQLYDDWDFLESILEDNEQGVSLMLDHVAPLLRYIAFKINQRSIN